MIIADVIVEKITVLITLGIIAQWFAWRFKIPSIVLLSVFGILFGPVLGWINPADDFGQAMDVLIKLAVSIIMFEGGLSLRFKDLKLAGSGVRRLVFLGLPISWVLGTMCAYYIIGLSFPVATMLGAILVVTGPTVIGPLLRQTKLNNRVSSLIRWEGILNDPVGVLLTIFLFEYFTLAHLGHNIVLAIFLAIVSSLVIGALSAYLVKYTFNNGLVPDFLKVPVMLCMVILVYTASNLIQQESGLLAVTIFGSILANIGLDIIQEIKRFKEDIAVFLISAVFIILTASLDVSHLKIINMDIVLFFIAILFVVRPAAVWLSTIGVNLSWQEKMLAGWIAPRGVVAASFAGLFAPHMIEHGFYGAEFIVPIVFSIVLITISVHSLSLKPLAKKLNLSRGENNNVIIVGAHTWTMELAKVLKRENIHVTLVDSSQRNLISAQKRNINTFCGDVISDYYEESPESLTFFATTKYLLAATDNDAYNTLICSTFVKSQDVDYPLYLSTHEDIKSSTLVKGLIAFDGNIRYEQLIEKHFIGWKFKSFVIDESFDYDKFKNENKKAAIPIFLLSKSNTIEFERIRNSLKPVVGDKLYCFVASDFDFKASETN